MCPRIGSLLSLALCAASALAQSSSPLPITAKQVADALSATGMAVGPGRVALPVRVVSSAPAPVLRVLAIEPPAQVTSARHTPPQARIRLACALPSQCLPFYALLSWPELSPRPQPANTTPITSQAITMHAGAHATLILDDHRSHIQMAVISLQSGVTGQRIRLTSPDHKHFYYGEVVNAGLLQGSF